jgi:hypothetical protein
MANALSPKFPWGDHVAPPSLVYQIAAFGSDTLAHVAMQAP